MAEYEVWGFTIRKSASGKNIWPNELKWEATRRIRGEGQLLECSLAQNSRAPNHRSALLRLRNQNVRGYSKRRQRRCFQLASFHNVGW